jgi:hypothetical protein
MNKPYNQSQALHESAEDLNLLATKAFHDLLVADKILLPAWKDAALKLSENDVPQNVDAFKTLIQGGEHADAKTTQN